MKKILIGIPNLTGKLPIQTVFSLIETLKLSNKELYIDYITVSFDSILTKVRNDIMYFMKGSDFDELIMIDDDEYWNPEDFLKLVNIEKDFVGIPIIKKNNIETYNVRAKEILEKNKKFILENDGTIEVDGIGTGFLKLTKKAINLLWDNSEKYIDNGIEKSNIFETAVDENDNSFISEDINLSNKWKKLEGKIFILPSIKINHIYQTQLSGSFLNWIKVNNLF